MRTQIIAFLFFHFAFEVHVYDLKVKKIQTFNEISCQKITAYYNGTFQFEHTTEPTLDAQLEISLDINLEDKRIYFKTNNYRSKFSNVYEFWLATPDDQVQCKSDRTELCSVKFYELPYFWIKFKIYNTVYVFDFMNIRVVLNNSFTLVDAVGNCATSLKNNYPNLFSPLYKRCFCCGDKYNPDLSLDCPVSPWN